MSNSESRNAVGMTGTLETNYRMLLEKSIDAIVVVGQDGLIRFVNQAAETILGNEAAGLLCESFHSSLESGETTEIAITHSDGETAVAEMRVMEVEWQGESAYFVSLHDITERKQAEEAARESEGRYKTLTDNLNVAVYRNTPGPKGKFMEVNPAHFRMFGYESKEEFLSVDVADLYQNPEDRIELSEKLSRFGSAEEELQLKRKDGTPFIGLVSAVAVKDENHKVLYFDGIIEDITESKQTEEAIRIQRDLGLALSATDDLEEAMRLCVEAAMVIGGMDCGGIYLVDKESGEMNLEFHKGISTEFAESVSRYDADLMNTHLVMAGKPIYSEYGEIGVFIDEIRRREGLKAISIIPVNHEGQIIACLIASSHTLDCVPPTTRNALETIASQMGSSLTRIQTAAVLRDSEKRYRFLVENANDVILLVQDGSIEYVNPKIVEVMGYSQDEMKSRPFADFIHPDDLKNVLEHYQRGLEHDQRGLEHYQRGLEHYEKWLKGEDAPSLYSFRGISKDGKIKQIQANSNVIIWGGRPATLSFLTDVTEREKAEKALRESERKYRLLIETADAAISVISGDGDFLLLNNQAAAQMDGKPDDFMGKNLSDVYQGETLKEYMAEIHEIINSGQGHTREGLAKLPAGEKWLSINIQPIVEQDGSISSIQVISQDITRYKKQEEALLRNLEREDQAFQHGRLEIVDTILHNIGNAMNSVTIGSGTAQKKVATLTRYLCSLADAIKKNQDDFSHYVEKDPQGQKVAPFIIALADEFGEKDGSLMETVDRVAERAEHVAEIIRTVESVTGKMYRKDIDLRKAVEDAITVLKYSIEKRHIEVNYDCDRAPAEISSHESQFHQMLVNLIKNSMEAIDDLVETDGTNRTHSIEIRCSTESDSLILEVTDDGIGIEESLLSVIFRPGYSTKKSGTGSGLHSIANFIKRCDGHIQALSDGPGKGATIRVELPLAAD